MSRPSRRATRSSRRSASITQRVRSQAGGNMEGKEARFGIANSALWASATTAASNGSVNSMHDSFTPLGGLVPLWLIQLGEVVFGGVGSGLYGMLMFAIVAVFIAGLMVGRTPEYLGKKIEAFEMKMASLVDPRAAAVVLVGTAIAVRHAERGGAGIANPGAHGFSEILYAFSSAGNNNGSAFAGLRRTRRSTTWRSASRCGSSRYWLMIPVLGDRGQPRGQAHDRGDRGHVADAHAALRRVARRRRADGRRAHVRARARARADRRAPADDRNGLSMNATALRVERPMNFLDAADRLGRSPRRRSRSCTRACSSATR